MIPKLGSLKDKLAALEKLRLAKLAEKPKAIKVEVDNKPHKGRKK